MQEMELRWNYMKGNDNPRNEIKMPLHDIREKAIMKDRVELNWHYIGIKMALHEIK